MTNVLFKIDLKILPINLSLLIATYAAEPISVDYFTSYNNELVEMELLALGSFRDFACR